MDRCTSPYDAGTCGFGAFRRPLERSWRQGVARGPGARARREGSGDKGPSAKTQREGVTQRRSERGTVMADPGLPSADARLDHDEVEAQREAWDRIPVRQDASVQQAVGRLTHSSALAVIDCLLGVTEVPPGTPTDLDHDQCAGRRRIHGDHVQLAPTDVHIAREDGPAGGDERLDDERFRRVAGDLCRRAAQRGRSCELAIGDSIRRWALPARNRRCIAAYRGRPRAARFAAGGPQATSARNGLQPREIDQVERRLIGHHRHELARQQRMGRG